MEVKNRFIELRADVLQPVGAAFAEPRHCVRERLGIRDHLRDCASARDARHGRADEKGPSNPPVQLEQGKVCAVPLPSFGRPDPTGKGFGAEGNLNGSCLACPPF